MKKENPYREGSIYNKLFEVLTRSPVTRQKLVQFARTSLRKRATAANAAVAVVLSPRKDSKRGDRRGNLSSQGHLYFVEKTVAKKGGTKVPMYRFHWRQKAMKPRRVAA